MLLSNNEQRKHIAVTFRLLGIGSLVSVASKALIGNIDLSDISAYALVFIALVLEIQALVILRGVTND